MSRIPNVSALIESLPRTVGAFTRTSVQTLSRKECNITVHSPLASDPSKVWNMPCNVEWISITGVTALQFAALIDARLPLHAQSWLELALKESQVPKKTTSLYAVPINGLLEVAACTAFETPEPFVAELLKSKPNARAMSEFSDSYQKSLTLIRNACAEAKRIAVRYRHLH